MFQREPSGYLRVFRFAALFAEEILPSQLLLFLEQQLNDDSVPWTVVSDPVDLAYFTVADYYHEFPFVFETDIDRVIYLFRAMRTEDVHDEILSAARIHSSNNHFVLRIHGFNKDSRPLWQIPEALELLRAFVRGGGISILLPFGMFELEPVGDAKISILSGEANIKMKGARSALGEHPLGAFECWVAARGNMETFIRDPQRNIPELWSRFLPALTKARRTLDEILRVGSLRPDAGTNSGARKKKLVSMDRSCGTR